MKIFCVRVGTRYDKQYEDYINSKLDNVIWLHEPINPYILGQWNKLHGMTFELDEPLLVLDIDILLMNDYMELINYPVKRGQFLSIQAWWGQSINPKYKLQGGFQKYYPKDCLYIYEKFMKDPAYWQQHYIKNGTTEGPINGEQYFVEDSVNERLELVWAPAEWMGVMTNQGRRWLAYINNLYPGEWYYLGEEYHPDIKLVHFQGPLNRPF